MDWYSIHLRKRTIVRWFSEHLVFPKIAPGFLLLLIQLIGCGCTIYGISLYSHPIAFIIGGLAAIIAVERQSHQPKMNPEQVWHYQRQIKLALAASKDPFSDPYNVPLTAAWVTYAASLRKQR